MTKQKLTTVAVFADVGWDVVAFVIPMYSFTGIQYYLADPLAIKVVAGNRAVFSKNVEVYETVIGFFGPNLITTEGETWSRLRKLVNPSFSETSIRYVWEQSVRLVNEMFEADQWAGKTTLIKHAPDMTKEITLLIIGAVAFGQETHWEAASATLPAGHQMKFQEAVGIVSEDLLFRVAMPSFVWGNKETRKRIGLGGIASWGWLGPKLKKIAIACAELEQYMEEIFIEQSKNGSQDRRDLISQLVRGSGEDAEDRLSMREVIGNTFIFLIAGHETTAHSLAFLWGLLALEEDKQEELYSHITAVLGDKQPVYEDVSSLNLVLAYLYESLRLFPPVVNTPKYATQDTTIPVTPAVVYDGVSQVDPLAKPKSLFVPKGTEVLVSVTGLHYNPRYWKDPKEFKPERFLEPDWPRDAFAGFSLGARACIGRRFAEVEAIAIISLVIKRYKITVDESRFPTIAGEEPLARRERLLASDSLISLTPRSIPLIFTRR
ncbi:hypothetical protein FRC05_001808 [Tulasnella sp. 425]|nr:hypothetical protein FRC05_001808 [Tulasnella sp. 425]